jgi:hypothetical protein
MAVNECPVLPHHRGQNGQCYNPRVERSGFEQTIGTYPRSRIVLLLTRNVFLSIPPRLNLCLVGGIQHVVISPCWATTCGGAWRPSFGCVSAPTTLWAALVCAARVFRVSVSRFPNVPAFVTGQDRRPTPRAVVVGCARVGPCSTVVLRAPGGCMPLKRLEREHTTHVLD